MLRSHAWVPFILILGACLPVTPPHPNAVRNNTICAEYMGQEQLEKAATYCDLALEYSPTYSDALVNRGLIEQKRGNTTKAKDYYIRALRNNNDQAQAYNNMGVIYQQDSQYGRAHDSFMRALKVDPNYIAARYNLAVTLVKLKRLDGAKQELRTLVAVNPNLADPHYLLGQIAYDEGSADEAIEQLTRAVELSPHFPEALELLGDVSMDRGRFEQARDAYSQCIQADAENAECRKKLPLAARRQALMDAGMKSAEQNRTMDNTPSSLYELSRTYADKGLKDKQEETLLHCIRLDNNYAQCHFALFQFYNDEGKAQEAQIACKNYVKFANSEENAQELSTCEKFLTASTP